MVELTTAASIGLLTAGFFLITGMATGVWKYVEMLKSPKSEAPYYVNIAHRASLMYSSATLVLACLAQFSAFKEAINIGAMIAPLMFFAIAIAMYIVAGIKNETDNQVRDLDGAGKFFMVLLIVAELGGAVCLTLGAALTLMF